MTRKFHDIQLLDSHRVDFRKWDECVSNSGNCLIYALSEYLNYTTDNWKAVVVDDYAAVMPIPWRRKFGVTYSYHVPFLQQTGIYSTAGSLNVEQAVKIIRSFCSYGYYYFNFAQHDVRCQRMTNMVLPLDVSVAELSKGFTPEANRDIRRASQLNLHYNQGSIEEAISLYKKLYQSSLKISANQYESFRALCRSLTHTDSVLVRKVQDAAGDTLAIIMLLRFKNRLYNIVNAISQTGRQLSANYLLFHSVFQEFESSGYLFDFEGSDHPGIQHFYLHFTRTDQPYYRYFFNDLPFPLRLFK